MRLVSLAAQRFVAQVLEEARQAHKHRQLAPAAKLKEQGWDPRDKRELLQTEDLVKALEEVGGWVGCIVHRLMSSHDVVAWASGACGQPGPRDAAQANDSRHGYVPPACSMASRWAGRRTTQPPTSRSDARAHAALPSVLSTLTLPWMPNSAPTP